MLKFNINIAVSTFPPGQEGVGGWQGLGAVLSNGSRCRLLNGDYRHSLTDRQTHLHGHCEQSSSRNGLRDFDMNPSAASAGGHRLVKSSDCSATSNTRRVVTCRIQVVLRCAAKQVSSCRRWQRHLRASISLSFAFLVGHFSYQTRPFAAHPPPGTAPALGNTYFVVRSLSSESSRERPIKLVEKQKKSLLDCDIPSNLLKHLNLSIA